MKKTNIFTAGLLAISATQLPSALADASSPVQMIQTGYNDITQGVWIGSSDPEAVDIAPPQLTASWYTPRFIVALKKNNACYQNGGEGSVISVWYNGQDSGNITQVSVAKLNGSAGTQTVEANVHEKIATEKHDFVLKSSGAAWLIDDVIVNGQSSYALMMKGCPK